MDGMIKTVKCEICHNTIEMKAFHVSKAKYSFAHKGYICEDCLRHQKEHGTFEGRVRPDVKEEDYCHECQRDTEKVDEQPRDDADTAENNAKKKKTGKITLAKKKYNASGDGDAKDNQ